MESSPLIKVMMDVRSSGVGFSVLREVVVARTSVRIRDRESSELPARRTLTTVTTRLPSQSTVRSATASERTAPVVTRLGF